MKERGLRVGSVIGLSFQDYRLPENRYHVIPQNLCGFSGTSDDEVYFGYIINV
jgi:hypothetical protein